MTHDELIAEAAKFPFFRERLRVAMARKDVNGPQLAEMIGATKSRVSEYRTGARLPTFSTFVAICHALDVSLDWITTPAPVELKDSSDD